MQEDELEFLVPFANHASTTSLNGRSEGYLKSLTRLFYANNTDVLETATVIQAQIDLIQEMLDEHRCDVEDEGNMVIEIARLNDLLGLFDRGNQNFQSMRHVSHPDFPSWRRMYKNIFMSSRRNLWSFGLNTGQHLFQALFPDRCCVSLCDPTLGMLEIQPFIRQDGELVRCGGPVTVLHNVHRTLDDDARYVGQQKIPETLRLTDGVIDQSVIDAVNRANALYDPALLDESIDAVTRGSRLWRPVNRDLNRQVTIRIKRGEDRPFAAPIVLSKSNDDRARVLAIGGEFDGSCYKLANNLNGCTTDYTELYFNGLGGLHFAVLRLVDKRVFYIDLGSRSGSVEVIRTFGQSDNVFHEIKTVLDSSKKLATFGDALTMESQFVDLLKGADTVDRTQPLMGIELKSGSIIKAGNVYMMFSTATAKQQRELI